MPTKYSGTTCQKCMGRGCQQCNFIGTYIISFHNDFGDVANRCDSCRGEGCELCQWTGWIVTHHKYPEYSPINTADLVPMPYGEILPDLTDCEYPNEEEDNYLEPILCPCCNSTNIVILDHVHNPELIEEQVGLGDRWFCISCQDSWCYEREH